MFCFGGGGGGSKRGESSSAVRQGGRKRSVPALSAQAAPSSCLPAHLPSDAGLALHWASGRPCLISRRLLSAHPSVDKWLAGWLLVTPAWRGPPLWLCLAIWAGAQGGGSHSGGGLPSPTPEAFHPRTTLLGHSIHRTGIQARKLILSHHPSLPCFCSKLTMRVGSGIVIPLSRRRTEAQRGDVTHCRSYNKVLLKGRAHRPQAPGPTLLRKLNGWDTITCHTWALVSSLP